MYDLPVCITNAGVQFQQLENISNPAPQLYYYYTPTHAMTLVNLHFYKLSYVTSQHWIKKRGILINICGMYGKKGIWPVKKHYSVWKYSGQTGLTVWRSRQQGPFGIWTRYLTAQGPFRHTKVRWIAQERPIYYHVEGNLLYQILLSVNSANFNFSSILLNSFYSLKTGVFGIWERITY